MRRAIRLRHLALDHELHHLSRGADARHRRKLSSSEAAAHAHAYLHDTQNQRELTRCSTITAGDFPTGSTRSDADSS